MRRHIAALIALGSNAAVASPQVPDSAKVTSITEAAKLCELSEAGIDWKENLPTTISIWVTEADLSSPSPKMDLLKACFFDWAYDRHVTVEFNMKKP